MIATSYNRTIFVLYDMHIVVDEGAELVVKVKAELGTVFVVVFFVTFVVNRASWRYYIELKNGL